MRISSHRNTPGRKTSAREKTVTPLEQSQGAAEHPTSVTGSNACQVEKAQKVYYYGESHRTLYDRAKDHFSALRKQDTNYAIVKHWHESHQHMETPPDFSISLVRSHKSSLERQIHGAVLIELADPQVILMNGTR